MSKPIDEKSQIPATTRAKARGVMLTLTPNAPMPMASIRRIENDMIIRYQMNLARIHSDFFKGVVLRSLK